MITILVLCSLTICLIPQSSGLYTDEFVVQILGGVEEARAVADELGFTYVRPVHPVDDHYSIVHKKLPSRHKRRAGKHTRSLQGHPKVLWVEQQKIKIREKRDPLTMQLTELERKAEAKAYKDYKSFDDPMWKSKNQDWYMNDQNPTPTDNASSTKIDLGIIPVWEKGYTGKGVVLTILDDGLEWNNTDIYDNYAPEASYDLNDEDDDPFPRYDFTDENRHGTRCAGVIAMVANNNFCGVGIAPDARIGGIRMLDGSVTDSVEARAIGFNVENIDIMSASWGPSDNGRMVNGPGKLSQASLEKGVTKGRRGLGTIYVWASGNGGHRGDNCECDGYVSSPYSISVSSATTRMNSPYYVEHCPSTMATTFSSGGYSELQIVTTTLHNECTSFFTGTSAAAPQAAGIIALVLEANKRLTWRDVQHLIAWSASPYILYNNPGWQTNAAGFKVNHRFGFGLMNAIEMVELAEVWENVGERVKCEVKVMERLSRLISANDTVYMDIPVSDCGVSYIEHIELVMTIKYSKRGDLSIDLTSAQGTTVSMMRPRDNDNNDVGYEDWPFMSVQTWGENPHGNWRVKVFDDHKDGKSQGTVESVLLRIYGTKEMPGVMKKASGHRRAYNFQLRDVIKHKYTPDYSGDLIGKVAGFLGIN